MGLIRIFLSFIKISIDTETIDVEDGFEYIEKSNKWLIDDGFLFGLKNQDRSKM